MEARHQIDRGSPVRQCRICERSSLSAVLGRDDPACIHKTLRQTDSPAPYGGESLGAIPKGPPSVGKMPEKERALPGDVPRGAGLEPWH
jgi:hypothetical protein